MRTGLTDNRAGAALLAVLLLAACSPPPDPRLGRSERAVHTVCGGGKTVKGIDVSKWQGKVNWPSVKQDGRVFAIARVSDGLSYLDGEFSANWNGMQSAGLVRGAYQYLRPNLDARQQADLFVDTIEAAGGFKPGDLPGVLDVETDGGLSAAGVAGAIDTWIARVEQRTNRRPIIYTGSYFWDDNGLPGKYAAYPLWTAHYTSKPCPLVPDAWSAWRLWQYTDKDGVAGVSGGVDGDVFNGTLADLKAFAAASVIVKPDSGSAPPDLGAPPPLLDGAPNGELSVGRPDSGAPPPGLDPGMGAGTLAGGSGCALSSPSGSGAPLAAPGLLLLLLCATLRARPGRRAARRACR